MIRGDRARRALFVRREQKPKLHVMATDRDHNHRGDDHHTRGVRVDGDEAVMMAVAAAEVASETEDGEEIFILREFGSETTGMRSITGKMNKKSLRHLDA